jgi:hypothetical protein
LFSLVSALVLLGDQAERQAPQRFGFDRFVWVRKEFQRVEFERVDFEIVFGGPAESKGAKRAVAPGFSVELSQENEVRNRLRETDAQSR